MIFIAFNANQQIINIKNSSLVIYVLGMEYQVHCPIMLICSWFIFWKIWTVEQQSNLIFKTQRMPSAVFMLSIVRLTQLMINIYHHQRYSRSIGLKYVSVLIFMCRVAEYLCSLASIFASLHCFVCLHQFLPSVHVLLLATQLVHYLNTLNSPGVTR